MRPIENLQNFFLVYRKNGFSESLDALCSFPNCEAKQNDFYKVLKERGSYLNAFFRVKDDLLKGKIIAYKLDENYEKVILLTEKGKDLVKKIREIEVLLHSDEK
jgi:predicted transcriptional regulator